MSDRLFDIWFRFYEKEIGLEQLRAQLKDIGWTDDDIDAALDDDGGRDDE